MKATDPLSDQTAPGVSQKRIIYFPSFFSSPPLHFPILSTLLLAFQDKNRRRGWVRPEERDFPRQFSFFLPPPIFSPHLSGARPSSAPIYFPLSSRPTCFNNGAERRGRKTDVLRHRKSKRTMGWFLFDSAVMANGYTHKQHIAIQHHHDRQCLPLPSPLFDRCNKTLSPSGKRRRRRTPFEC